MRPQDIGLVIHGAVGALSTPHGEGTQKEGAYLKEEDYFT